jgi:hypothetical protein
VSGKYLLLIIIVRVGSVLLVLTGSAAFLAREAAFGAHLPILRTSYTPHRSWPHYYVVDVQTHITLEDPHPGSIVPPPLLSPDGQWTAFYGDDGNETAVDSYGLRIAPTLTDPSRLLSEYGERAWSGDSRYFAYTDEANQLKMMKPDGSKTWVVANGVVHIFVSPDGTWLSYSRRLGYTVHFYVMPFRPDGEARVIPELPPQFEFVKVIWSPDSRSFLISARYSETNDVSWFEVESDLRPHRLTDTPDMNETDAIWSPDGQYISVASSRRTDSSPGFTSDVSVIAVATGENQRWITDVSDSPSYFGSWSPDGRWFAFKSKNGVGLYDMRAGKLDEVAGFPQNYFGGLHWSADSNWLAFETYPYTPSPADGAYVLYLPTRWVFYVARQGGSNGWYESAQALMDDGL